MARRTYPPSFKFSVVIEALRSDRTEAEVARSHGLHPVTLSSWKRKFLADGAQVFANDSSQKENEEKLAQLERMLGQKEVELALLRNFTRGS
jgi:transposase